MIDKDILFMINRTLLGDKLVWIREPPNKVFLFYRLVTNLLNQSTTVIIAACSGNLSGMAFCVMLFLSNQQISMKGIVKKKKLFWCNIFLSNFVLTNARWFCGRAQSYNGIAPGLIPGVSRNFGLPVDPADIEMNGQLVCLDQAK